MNPKRILISLVVAFAALTATDFLIHEIWLKSAYLPDKGKLWLAEPNMLDIHIGHVLLAFGFTMLWARIAFSGAGLPCAIALGVFLGLILAGRDVIEVGVRPTPDGLLTKWIIADMAQSILIGVLLFFTNKPAKSCPDLSGK